MKYEITLTLRPYIYKEVPQHQFKIAVKMLEEILPLYQVSLVAELTQENNVHFHGIIELSDLIERNKFLNRFRRFHKLFGKKTVNQVKFEDSYIKYMKKDIENTKLIIPDPIVRDSFGIFGNLFPEPILQQAEQIDEIYEQLILSD